MNDDWLDILLRGTYEVGLPALTVTSEEIGTLRGSGQFSWKADSGIRIQATTAGGELLTRLAFGGYGIPGRLLSHSSYLAFSGQTNDEWRVSADPIPRDGHHTNTNLPDVVWDLNTPGLTFHCEREGQTGRGLRILIGPIPPVWVKDTVTEVRNDVFGMELRTRDWLITSCGLGRVAARKRSDEWFEVRVQAQNDGQDFEGSSVCTAVTRAFGFVLGRRCVIRGHEEINGNKVTRRLDSGYSKTTRNALLQPIGRQVEFGQNVERLLGLAIDFFQTELGERVAPYLYLCWDTADNSHQTRLAISSICTEGLLRVAAQALGPAQPTVDQADLAAFRAWIKTSPEGFSQQFLKRIDGLTGAFRNLSVNEIFRDWISRGILAVTKEDSDSWSATRNPSVHGQLSPAGCQDEVQTRISQHYRVQNLMNKILLQLMGYTGEYIDYAQSGFPAVQFPFIALQERAAPEESLPPASVPSPTTFHNQR